MLCRLCLVDCDDLLEIFDRVGERLQIQSIIEQHFGFQLRDNDQISSKICSTCWIEVENFHAFYVDVKRAQDKLLVELAKNVDPDPDTDENDGESDDPNRSDYMEDDDYDSDPSYFNESMFCDPSKLSAILRDTSNVSGDIDIFAAPSRTGSNIVTRGKHKSKANENYLSTENNIIIVDLGTSKSRNTENGIPKFYSSAYKNFNKSTHSDHEVIRNNFKSLGIPGLNNILDRNELSITAVPKSEEDDDSLPRKNENEISKYIQLTCELCREKFNIFSDLKNHFRTIHKISGYVVCCNEKLFEPVNLVDHVMKHLDRSRFISDSPFDSTSDAKNCPFCQKTFVDRDQLSRHLHNHYMKKTTRAQCQQCGLWCKSRYILNKHVRTHVVDSDDLVCTICRKKFLSDIALQRHLTNVHYKERNYQCTVCDKAFKWSINLKEHMGTHTGKRLYSCMFCSKKFNASSNLHSHRKKMHREEWEEERKQRLELVMNDAS